MEFKQIVLYAIIALTLVTAIIMMFALKKNFGKALVQNNLIDRLTGLYTYEGFIQKLNKKNNELVSILTLDIFQSHNIENQIGTDEFESILVNISNIILSKLGKYRLASYYNYDVFSIVLKTENTTDAIKFAEDISLEVAKLGNQLFTIDLFWGVAVGYEREETLKKSLLAVKFAKRQNNKILIYNEDIAKTQNLFDKILHDPSIIKDEFSVFYQPKVNATTGEIVGAEALIRWIDNQGNVVMYPNQFISEFEQNGLISKIDLFVLEEVCKFLESINKRGKKSIVVSLNFSRANFTNPTIINEVKDIVSRYIFKREFLHIEITESAYVKNEDFVANTLLKFNEIGLKIEMDDFGSGYSSFGSLMNLKCSVVKMDRLFVENNLKLKTEQIFLESLVKMFHGIGLEITVEGVESEYVVRQIRKMAPDILIQGYYFFKPMPLSKLERILQDNRFVLDDIFNEPVDYNKAVFIEESYGDSPSSIIVEEEIVEEHIIEEPVIEEVIEEEPEVEQIVEEPVVQETVVEEPKERIIERIIYKEVPVYIPTPMPQPEPQKVVEPEVEEEEEEEEIVEEEVIEEVVEDETSFDDLDLQDYDDFIDSVDEEEANTLKLIEEYKKKYREEWEAEMLKKHPELMKKHYEKKLFIDKVMNLDATQKENYNTLKNAIMRHEGIINRTSKYFDSFVVKNKTVCKLGVVGKSIRLFLALDPNAYPSGQFPHKDVSDVKRHEKTPYMMKVSSNLSVKRALKLISDLCVNIKSDEIPDYKDKNYVKGFQLAKSRNK